MVFRDIFFVKTSGRLSCTYIYIVFGVTTLIRPIKNQKNIDRVHQYFLNNTLKFAATSKIYIKTCNNKADLLHLNKAEIVHRTTLILIYKIQFKEFL